jgi:NitT/TauT family transport system ATP-binding protein
VSTTRLRIGFLPLVDAALPILARELGFAEAEGLTLDLVRDMSWATVCDRLIYGNTDAAHLLAPLAIATTLGLGRPPLPLSVPFVLGLNGNAVTMRPDLARQVVPDGAPADIRLMGTRLAAVVAAAAAAGRRLRFGVVHRHSSHNYMLRYWLMASGIDPNRDVSIVTVAPPFAADALASGDVDGICVGEPWNSVAVAQGAGEIVAVTSQIWLRGVEKVLAVRAAFPEQDSDTLHRLVRALYRAGEAFVDPARLEPIAEILAGAAYLDGSAELIRNAISDRIVFARGAEAVSVPDFMFQHREAANFPWTSQAAWLYAQMVLAGHATLNPEDFRLAQQVFRPDIYRAALREMPIAIPGASAKLEGGIANPLGVGTARGRLILGPDRFFDGRHFDPDQLNAYLAGFSGTWNSA